MMSRKSGNVSTAVQYSSRVGCWRQVARILLKTGYLLNSLSMIPAWMNPCCMLSFEHAVVDLRLRKDIFSEWNMLLIKRFMGHLSTGMSLTVCVGWIFLMILNTGIRLAGCSTPEQTAFCLFAMILFSVKSSADCVTAYTWDRLPSLQATAVALSGIEVPAAISKSQYFFHWRFIPGMSIFSW